MVDTSTVHYPNTEQGNIDFRKNNLGATGSTINIYEWIESNVSLMNIPGEGTVKDVNRFTVAMFTIVVVIAHKLDIIFG